MRTIANPGRSLLNGCALLLAVLSAGFAGPLCAEDFDLFPTSCRVIDPESKLDTLRDGVIRSVSAEPLLGQVMVDIGGLVVALGFPLAATPGCSVRSPLVAE